MQKKNYKMWYVIVKEIKKVINISGCKQTDLNSSIGLKFVSCATLWTMRVLLLENKNIILTCSNIIKKKKKFSTYCPAEIDDNLM